VGLGTTPFRARRYFHNRHLFSVIRSINTYVLTVTLWRALYKPNSHFMV